MFASPGSKKWDTCAPEAILKCFGGILTDVYGKPYSYSIGATCPNSTGVLAAASLEQHEKCKVAIKKNNVIV